MWWYEVLNNYNNYYSCTTPALNMTIELGQCSVIRLYQQVYWDHNTKIKHIEQRVLQYEEGLGGKTNH